MTASNNNHKPIGAVLVVGAGISGMQSSLDLAEAGLKVYLVEEKPAIGGTMARLDKTFPTNDCAMCIVSPKLVDVGRHLNIDVITGARLEQVEGEPGRFKVRVRQKARYVDLDKCTGCGECAAVCPVELPGEFDEGLGKRKAIYKMYAQAMPTAYAVDKRGVPPCRAACPAGVNAQGYIQLLKQGHLLDAWQLIYRDNPFPAVCGRVCTHPCESACHRGDIDGPVQIRQLKRYITDGLYGICENLPLPEKEPDRGKRVAVVGSGPAGLSAAYQLVKRGYGVTVFEKNPVPGGTLVTGIPEYRLPREYVEFEIGLLQKYGVEIKLNSPIGENLKIADLFEQGYEAVFIATGLSVPYRLGVEGENLPGVIPGIDFLRQVNLGEEIKLHGRVAVIGGGNVAVDTARTALRCGAGEVHVFSLESASEMPASKEEIDLAVEEGVVFHHRRGVNRILGDKRVNGLELSRVTRLFDEQGRFDPQYSEDDTVTMPFEFVLISIGQGLNDSFVSEKEMELISPRGTIRVDEETLETPLPGIFAGGDAATGPRDVISAIGTGKRAAESIHRYLEGVSCRDNRLFKVPAENIAPRRQSPEEIPHHPPLPIQHRPLTGDASLWEEETLGFTSQQALSEAERCLNCGVCSECGRCVSTCQAGAIDHNMTDREIELEVGAIILSPGGSTFDPAALEYLGYTKSPNVITSIEFERILSASGPYQGHMQRPGDGKEPKKIAWIQCVGSRNLRIHKNYCSSVCCMYAIKEAVIAMEHASGPLEAVIFNMDMRTYGKDFEKYYTRARDEYGVRFEKSRIFSVEPMHDESGDLFIRYAREDGSIGEEVFDLVVLSVGLEAGCGTEELARVSGIELNQHGFCKIGDLRLGITSRPGIFAAGVFAGPKDIPETVIEASAAAGHASGLLAAARGTCTKVKEYPPEKPVGDGPPRIGVFVCNCGINIGSVVDVPGTVEYAKTLPNVVFAREFLFTCSQDSIEKIKDAIAEHDLTRVVVASCTPRTHAPLFQSALREAGLNPYLYEHVNIREHSSWVHRNNPVAATAKAKDLVRMAVAKVALLKPVQPVYTLIKPTALVVGGGAAGITAALSLARQGFEVHLVEKTGQLGGHLASVHYTLEGGDTQKLLSQLIEQVRENPRITVHMESEPVDFGGYTGNYRTTLRTADGKTMEIEHGALVLATGAQPMQTDEYLAGQHPGVLTQTEFEQRLANGAGKDLDTVVMIQCVGSRDDNHPWCSRVCCGQALKNALKLKEQNPNAQVYVLYRDLRAYGTKEEYYTAARQKGVVFIRYDLNNKPRVAADGDKLAVTVTDHILGQEILLTPDLLVLSTGIKPSEENAALSKLFKVPLDADGFLLEAHMKLRPVDFAAEGLYLCGMAHGPKYAGESIVQAEAAAMRAATLLSKEKLENVAITATVNPRRCTGCGLCVAACNYNARELDPVTRIARVTEVLCQGCGACVAACPNGASQQKGFEKRQMLAALSAALTEEVS